MHFHVIRWSHPVVSWPSLHRFINSVPKNFQPKIGLEVHAQLKARTKLFSRAAYRFGAPSNSQITLLDAAIPGSLPVLYASFITP
ncbi:unnamed protein product [Protopolystoma xenopodis]|uniref:Aspartyl/Glutamyl-tRNA(Gln) amidotransferase subunit B/E catalytic domain-containing protein n=1 Tax=Protopolystoma xenopodis TaxID=117903 RepID=A0A448X6V9_9PLAT|nr:unnamed protein product [Protopolystoma xenopodis]